MRGHRGMFSVPRIEITLVSSANEGCGSGQSVASSWVV